MEQDKKPIGKVFSQYPLSVCIALYLLCYAFRLWEYFVLKTDESVIGENFIHKACGVVVIFAALFASGLHWRDIGFVRAGRLKNIGFGLALGFGFYTIAYAAECIVLYVQEASPSLTIASGGFSLVNSTEYVSTGIGFILLFNVLNVWMEEGLFRGLFTRLLRERYDCRMTIFITALLFGLWHLAMPVRSFIEGQLEFVPMLLLSAGYVVLSFVYGLKMSFLYRMTGSVWAGLSDHFFNNSIINIVHVASSMGSDHLQVVRIGTAQFLSFIFVCMLYVRKKKNVSVVF
ncbi:hypothetical protein HMPREF1221_02101 [Treponema socranskii subsp. paredis ATCC 35535]|nr:hypothetical protein HMPREF1221_02101 [Treponema socranskii subsp. paredis ATCC 35535]